MIASINDLATSCLLCPSQEIASPLWAAAGYNCYVGGHIAQVAIGAVLVVTFVTLAFLFTFLIYDSNPLSVDPTAKAHARTDVVFLACKVRCIVRSTCGVGQGTSSPTADHPRRPRRSVAAQPPKLGPRWHRLCIGRHLGRRLPHVDAVLPPLHVR